MASPRRFRKRQNRQRERSGGGAMRYGLGEPKRFAFGTNQSIGSRNKRSPGEVEQRVQALKDDSTEPQKN